MTWGKGAATITALLDAGMLQRVTASPDQARVMLDAARRHLASAAAIAPTDALGGCVLAYDAAR